MDRGVHFSLKKVDLRAQLARNKACTMADGKSVAHHEVDLDDAAYLYLKEKRYPEGCSVTRKRAIRKKADRFIIRDGVMFFKKMKKRGVRCAC